MPTAVVPSFCAGLVKGQLGRSISDNQICKPYLLPSRTEKVHKKKKKILC